MTNEERINKLCECVIDLIDMLQCHDRDLNKNLEWVRNEVMDIREEIYNSRV